jgi:hypothetical protein
MLILIGPGEVSVYVKLTTVNQQPSYLSVYLTVYLLVYLTVYLTVNRTGDLTVDLPVLQHPLANAPRPLASFGLESSLFPGTRLLVLEYHGLLAFRQT